MIFQSTLMFSNIFTYPVRSSNNKVVWLILLESNICKQKEIQ